jgi:hypothetical protein
MTSGCDIWAERDAEIMRDRAIFQMILALLLLGNNSRNLFPALFIK